MPFHQPDLIRYFSFDSLADAPLVQAVITRHGGLSPEPWDSLNVGGTVGDDAERVTRNRQLSFQACGLPLASLYDVYQVHGQEVVQAITPRPPEAPHIQADAILTDRPGVTLFMRFADCVPVFLYDPRRKVVGLVHAGWKGTFLGVAARAIEAMQEGYGCKPADLLACIGPSIGPDHYEVGEEVITQAHRAFGEQASSLLHADHTEQGGTGVKFDLWNANRLALEAAGVKQIEIAGICTACHVQDWYSHRKENGRTGRFGALIALV